MDFAVARHLDFEPFRKRVGTFRTDAVQSPGIFVGSLPEFTAGVKVRQDQLDCRHLPFRMNIDRDTASVVTHGYGTVDVHCDIDLGAISGEVFVDRVIENFKNEMMKTALIGVADVHSGAFPDGLETF